MSVQDIFKIQTAYNQNGTFNDQVDWQDAFKIADGFQKSASLGAKAQEDWRKYYANRDTHDTFVAAQNAVNRYTENNANWNTVFNDSTMQNKINYTNWDYGNKQLVGNLNFLDQNRKYENALQTDPSQIQSTIAQNNFNAANYGFQHSQLDGSNQLLLAQQEMQKQGILPTLENIEAYMKQNPTKFNQHAFGALTQQVVARENQHKKGFSDAVAMATEDIIDPLTGQVSGKKINEQKLRTLLGGMYLDPTSHAIIDERYRALAKDQGFVAPEYNIGAMQQGLHRFIGNPEYEKMLTPQQIEIGKTELRTMQDQAKSAVNDAFGGLNTFWRTPFTAEGSPQSAAVTPQPPQGVVLNGRFVPVPQGKSMADLFDWLEIEKTRARGRHW